jgi:hypothetical protein
MTRARVTIALRAVAAPEAAEPAAGSPAEPCLDGVIDPIVTPVRDVYLDAQRGACLRDELTVALRGHALIDTPGFYGALGGDVAVGARLVVGKAHELSAQLRAIDYAFVQNAVNKVSHAGLGPLVLGAAAGGELGAGARAALVLQLELPYTREQRDTAQISGQLQGVATGRLSRSLVLHTRLGALGLVATSEGGRTRRLALRAGADLAWQVRTRLALQAGVDTAAGWHAGLDHVLVRAGLHWRPGGGAWRLRTGLGLPRGGNERTNVVFDVGLVREL